MIKVLYDIEQLLSAKGKETGICRVTPAIVKETSLQKWWKKVKAKILPKPPVDYAPAFQALSKELIGLKGLVESLQKEIKTLENEQVMTQKMLVDEKTLLQKKRRF